MVTQKTNDAPAWACSLIVLIELIAMRVYLAICVWNNVVRIPQDIQSNVTELVIFGLGFALYTVLLILSFVRNRVSYLFLTVLVIVIPLASWGYVDLSVYWPSPIVEFALALLAQIRFALLFFLLLCFEPLLKGYFLKNEHGILRLLSKVRKVEQT